MNVVNGNHVVVLEVMAAARSLGMSWQQPNFVVVVALRYCLQCVFI